MARQPLNLQQNKVNETDYLDKYGAIALRFSSEQITAFRPGNIPVEQANHSQIALEDGSLWTPAMAVAQPPNKPGRLGICYRCRYPAGLIGRELASHGCTLLDAMKRCSVCRELCCPRHVRKIDGQWVCVECEARFKVQHLARRIFLNLFFKPR